MRFSNGWKTSGKALPVSQALPVVMSIGIAHRPMILFILIGFLILVWMDAYGLGVWQHQQRHRVHHISLFHVLGLGCPLAW